MATPPFPLLSLPGELIIAVGRAIPADRPADLRNLMLGNRLLHELLEPVLLDAATTYIVPQPGPLSGLYLTAPGWILSHERMHLLRKLLSRGLPLDTPVWMQKDVDTSANSVSAHPDSDYPLLYSAVGFRNADAVRIMLDLGGSLRRTFTRSNPWLAAGSTFFDNGEIPKMLVEAGFDVNQKWDEGMTALHYATDVITFGDFSRPAIKMLLSLGANVDAKNNAGFTPLTLVLEEWPSFTRVWDSDPTLRNDFELMLLDLVALLFKHSDDLEAVGQVYIPKALQMKDSEFARWIVKEMEECDPRT